MRSAYSVRSGVSDEVAFAELTEQYRSELQARCYRILRSVEDSEDAVQETMLRAWRSRSGIRSDLSVRAWLHRIATNASLDALHHRRKVARVAGREAEGGALESVAAPMPEPGDAVVARETVELAIRQLSPMQQTAFVLRYLFDCSAKDAAAALGTSPASVYSAAHRARAALRDELAE